MKVYLDTLGCKLNESEVEAWARRFGADGYEIVADARAADVCVLNTCAITHVAARKSRQAVRQLARANPNARVVLTGCYATMSPDEARQLPNVALVAPNDRKDELVDEIRDWSMEIVDSRLGIGQSPLSNLQSQLPTYHIPITNSRTRAFVKIQDGCNMSCTYCIIPRARGKERSRPLRDVIEEVKQLVEVGYQEIVLTGVQISAYADHVIASGAKQSPTSELEIASQNALAMTQGLRDLVAAILAETAVARLRLTSIAPWDFDADLLELWRDVRLCRHLHFSLQSGSDTVLRRMRRPYTAAQFARALEMAREYSPDVGITTDVIVGFPGETDAEFEGSLRFVESIGFARVHVFAYSPRAGTPAAAMPQVPERVKAARAKAMQAVADTSARAFAARFIGRELQVLWEGEEQTADGRPQMAEDVRRSAVGGRWSGYSNNYIRVTATSAVPLRNQITHAILTDVAEYNTAVIAT